MGNLSDSGLDALHACQLQEVCWHVQRRHRVHHRHPGDRAAICFRHQHLRRRRRVAELSKQAGDVLKIPGSGFAHCHERSFQ